MVASDESGFARDRKGAFDHLIERGDRRRLAMLLRSVREQAGLSQGDLAARLGVAQSVLSKIEAGYREVTVLELRVMCAALNVPLADFMRNLDDRLQEVR